MTDANTQSRRINHLVRAIDREVFNAQQFEVSAAERDGNTILMTGAHPLFRIEVHGTFPRGYSDFRQAICKSTYRYIAGGECESAHKGARACILYVKHKSDNVALTRAEFSAILDRVQSYLKG